MPKFVPDTPRKAAGGSRSPGRFVPDRPTGKRTPSDITPEHHGGGGFLHGFTHVFTHTIPVASESLGRELVGVGPGLYHNAAAPILDIASVFAPRKQPGLGGLVQGTGFSRTAAVGREAVTGAERTAIGLGTHPVRTIEQDPLGVIGLGAAAFGVGGSIIARGAEASRVASAGGTTADVTRAALKAPRVERTLTLGGQEVHPLPFKSPGGALLQKHVFDALRQFKLDNPESRFARVVPVSAQGFFGKVMAEENQAAGRLTSAPRSLVLQEGHVRGAVKNMALRMAGFGPTSEQVGQLENALKQAEAGVKGFGKPEDLRAELQLVKRAATHLDTEGRLVTPELQHAAAMLKIGVAHARDLRVGQGSLTEDQALARLGAQRAEIIHGANGYHGLSPVEELQGLREQLAAAPKPARASLQARIDALHSHLVSLGHEVEGNGGFYIPHTWEGKTKRGVGSGQVRSADVVKRPAGRERFKMYTGHGLRQGTRAVREPVASQVARDMSRSMAIEQRLAEHARLYQAAVKDPSRIRGAVRPIVNERQVSDELKAWMGRNDVAQPEGLSAQEHASAASSGDAELLKRLYPDVKDAPEGARWLPKAVVDRVAAPWTPVSRSLKVGLTLSQGARVKRYAPSYLKWWPQNLALSVIQQGPHMVGNVRAWHDFMASASPLEKAQVLQVAGAGYARALSESGALGAGSGALHYLGERWHNINDKFFRTVGFFHEAAREGYRTPDQIRALLADPYSQKYQLVARRAERALIKYSSGAGPVSKTLGRNAPVLVTSWPWLRGATEYTGRFPFEHPYQSAGFAQPGREGAKRTDDWYAKYGGVAPGYLERYLPTGPTSAVDTGWLNVAETPGAVAEAFSNRDQFQSSVMDAVGQAALADLADELRTGRDRFGRHVTRSQAVENFVSRVVPGVPKLGKKSKAPAIPQTEIQRLLQLLPWPVTSINYPNAARSGNIAKSGR